MAIAEVEYERSLDLPNSIPEALKNLIETRFPHSPFACDEFKYNCQYKLKEAIKFEHIQINPKGFISAIIVDIDRPGAMFAWEVAGLPAPTWITTHALNPMGHAHAVWLLRTPVYISHSAKAAQFAKDLQMRFTAAIGGDMNYRHLLTKNPANKKWRCTSPSNFSLYDLAELAEYAYTSCPVPKPPKPSKSLQSMIGTPADAGFGRNCYLFDEARIQAYSAVHNCDNKLIFFAKVASIVEEHNARLTLPLKAPESRGIARSIADWTWKNKSKLTTSEQFSAVQSERKRAGSVDRIIDLQKNIKKAKRLFKQGLSKSEIAKKMGVTDRTIRSWLN